MCVCVCVRVCVYLTEALSKVRKGICRMGTWGNGRLGILVSVYVQCRLARVGGIGE